MQDNNKNVIGIIIGIVIVAILVILIWMVGFGKSSAPISTVPVQTGTETPIATAMFVCNDNKTINATFYTGTTTIALSDGRTMTLGQTRSADGGRYANPDESFVFWTKGNGAMVLENNVQKSYIGCVVVAPGQANLPNVYQDGTNGISLRYPAGYTVDKAYTYQALGPGKDIKGVKFTIPKELAQGTNLSTDSYISIESIPNATKAGVAQNQSAASCTATPFVQSGAGAAAQTVTDDNGTIYSVASTSDAAAGNRYEETVYAIIGTSPCMAIRYFIHYGAIGNYPAGAVKEFDKQALVAQFDQIRKTLVLNR